MMTVGPHDIEVLTALDWATLIDYAVTQGIDPGELHGLAIAPEQINPEHLADELDDLLDTDPPDEIKTIIAVALRELVKAGVELAKRDQP